MTGQTSDQVRRIWSMAEIMYVDQPRSPEESRAIALAHLRETVRAEGYVIDADTLVSDEPHPIVVNADQTAYRAPEPGEEANAFLTHWSVGATERLAEVIEHLVDPTAVEDTEDAAGNLVETKVFTVPADLAEVGGGIRLRHGFDGPVTVAAYAEGDQPIGYLLAVALDENQEQVEIVPGTVRLLVTKDPDPDAEQTDLRDNPAGEGQE